MSQLRLFIETAVVIIIRQMEYSRNYLYVGLHVVAISVFAYIA